MQFGCSFSTLRKCRCISVSRKSVFSVWKIFHIAWEASGNVCVCACVCTCPHLHAHLSVDVYMWGGGVCVCVYLHLSMFACVDLQGLRSDHRLLSPAV